MKRILQRGRTITISKETNKIFLKRGILRILFSDIFSCNFFTFRQVPPMFSFLLSSEKTHTRILPILTKLVGKAPVGVFEWLSGGGMEIGALRRVQKEGTKVCKPLPTSPIVLN
jgi:hypothetical protein